MAEGYYLVLETEAPTDEYLKVIATLPLLIAVNGADGEATAKTDEVNVTKVIEQGGNKDTGTSSVDIGDFVTYRIDAEVPEYAANEYSVDQPVVFELHDEICEGLTISSENWELEVFGVKNGEPAATLESPDAYSVVGPTTGGTTYSNGQTFTVKFNYEEIKEYDYVSVKYKAQLNDKCKVETDSNNNKAWLEYTHNFGVTKKAGPAEVKTWTYKFPIYKYELDSDGTTKLALPGAEFVVYKEGSEPKEYVQYYEKVTYQKGEDGAVQYDGSGKPLEDPSKPHEIKEGEKISEGTHAGGYKFVSDEAGMIYLYGLDAGTYVVEEIKAPDGYSIAGNTIKFELKEEGTGDSADEIRPDKNTAKSTDPANGVINKNDEKAIEIVNSKDITLPSTGGIGTTIFYVLGALLVVIAGVVLVTRRRMNGK